VEKGRRVFGGDFFGAGQSGFSIYGDSFEDESFELRHLGPGTVGMRNCGPDSSNSQVYISLKALPELDGRCVVVGYVVEGWGVLRELDKGARTSGGRFREEHEFRVVGCGELK
jgi:cyclophilin family peptidyl-prolyl cis-trans isomerase